ncbi:MAG: hypothetical protein ACOVQ4_18810 [Flectobacillus sp.]|uniref:DUF3108 domain-containing protein n=1 Tax=Flectobacillus sp. TaxID=50419 RepID=UPI003B9942BC
MRKLHNRYLYFSILLLTFQLVNAQQSDTINITASNIKLNELKFTKACYLVYNTKTKNSPAEGIYMVNINVTKSIYKQQPAVIINQQWDGKDTIIHQAYTVLKKTDLSTRFHSIYWRGLKYSAKFDFDERNISFQGVIADSNKQKITTAFNESFETYNLNWHSDLFVFTCLPYKTFRTFRINFFDPGFGRPSQEFYTVIGSDALKISNRRIHCWVMQRTGKSAGSYQKFWIDKKTKLVIKEEDFSNNGYRFKLKVEVDENA